MRPFRFGVNVWHAQSRAEFAEKARKIEALGYDTLTLPDHLTDRIAPIPALVIAAEATKTLRVGTNVLNNDLRHPVLVAREAAAVDLLTEGRLQLGLGAGSIRSEYDQVGLGFDRGGTRVERLAEVVNIIKGLLKGEQLTFAGKHYRVTGHAIAPLPVQRPHPPILIGGLRLKRPTLWAVLGHAGLLCFRAVARERILNGLATSNRQSSWLRWPTRLSDRLFGVCMWKGVGAATCRARWNDSGGGKVN